MLREKCLKHAYPILNGFLSHLIGVPIKFDSWIKRRERKRKKERKVLLSHTPELEIVRESHGSFIWLPELHFESPLGKKVANDFSET